MATQLANLEALREYLSKGGDRADDQVIIAILEAASAWFENQIGDHILQAEYTEEFIASGGDTYVPVHQPTTAVSSLKINGEGVPLAVVGTFCEPGYRLMGGVIRLIGRRFRPGAVVELTYTAGYVEVPSDVSQAIIELSALAYRDRPRLGKSSQSLGGESVSYLPSIIPVKVKSVVDAYRVVF